MTKRQLKKLAGIMVAAAMLLWGGPGWAQDATWRGGTGSWSDSTLWSTGAIPDSNVNVFIDGGQTGINSVVNIDQLSSVRNLTIDAGDTLDVNDGQTLFTSGERIANNGLITMGGQFFNSPQTIINLTRDTELSGSGEMVLRAGGVRASIGLSETLVLTHGAEHTIRGQGEIGNQFRPTALINEGTIVADTISNSPLRIILSSASALNDRGGINRGTLQSEGFGRLEISTTDLDNTSGLIRAVSPNGGVLITNGSRITGGQLATENGGSIFLRDASLLEDVANLGTTIIGSGDVGNVLGTIDNSGVMQVQGGTLQLQGDTTFRGSGEVLLFNQNSIVTSVDPGTVLTNAAGHTFRGSGQLGQGQIGLVNAGVIQAQFSNGLTVELLNERDVERTNTGTFQALDGSRLTIAQGIIANAGGIIEAQDGGEVWITGSGSRINGGTLQGDGIIELRSDATLSNVKNTGAIQISAGEAGQMVGTINNDGGSIDIGSSAGSATLRIIGDTTFTGRGVLTLDNSQSSIINDSPAIAVLTNEADHTIRGFGRIDPGNNGLLNRGTIEATGGVLILGNFIQAGSGTVSILPDGELDLSSASQASSADYLDHQGRGLNLGDQDFIVARDYTNTNTGVGNAYDARANVVGSGQIIGEDVNMAIIGDDVKAVAENAYILDLGAHRVGDAPGQADYQIQNSGSGADIRGAIQTEVNGANITDPRLSGSGVESVNFGPIAAGEASENYTVQLSTTQAGILQNQALTVVGNFDNLAPQSIDVTGKVYQQAEAQVDTPSVDFGIVRVGDTVAQAVEVTNSAPQAGLNDTLAGGFVNLPAGPFGGTGTLAGLGAGLTDDTSLSVTLDTTTAGVYSNIGDFLQFSSQNPDMADLDLGMRELSLFAQVNNIANPEFNILNGPGSLSRIGNEFVLDIGNILDTTSPFVIQMSLLNDTFGPADLLSGSFNTNPGSGFTLNGFTSFAGLDAGDAYTDLFVNIDPFGLGLGTFSSVIASLEAVSSNDSGPDLLFSYDLRLNANVAPIPEPGTMALLALGLALLGLAARRGYLRR